MVCARVLSFSPSAGERHRHDRPQPGGAGGHAAQHQAGRECVRGGGSAGGHLPASGTGRAKKQTATTSSPPPPRSFYLLSCLSSVFGLPVTYFPPRFLHIVSAFKGSKPPLPPPPFQSVPSLPINTVTTTRPGHALAFLPHSTLLTQQRSRKRCTHEWQETCQHAPPSYMLTRRWC